MKKVSRWYVAMLCMAVSAVVFGALNPSRWQLVIGFVVGIIIGATALYATHWVRVVARIGTVKIVDSGAYKPYAPPIEAVHHPIPNPLFDAPFRVSFTLPESGLRAGPLHTETMAKRAMDKLKLHFGSTKWVCEDGKLSDEAPAGTSEASGHALLNISAQWGTPLLHALKLPDDGKPIAELRSDFALDHWKLCLTRKGNPTYHDHIVFEGGSFYLESVKRFSEKREGLIQRG